MELLPNRGNPPGLLKTYIVHRDENQVVLNEEWDISVPGCPMIRNPWGPQVPTDHIINQMVLTPEEFEMHFAEEGKIEVGR
jgi:hypothetical protein